jgi:ribulose-5-phosphate 4-epimerase/fuculose-1-phosphate aldolase
VLEASEGEHIAKAIGDKKAIILQNHGLLAASGSVEATVFWYISLEKLCQTHLIAMAAANSTGVAIKEVGDAEAKE